VFLSDSAGGEAVYRGAGRCLSCHGAAGEGVQNLGPSLRDAEWLQGDGSRTAIEHVVAAGVSPPRVFPIAMPAYADQLSPEQIRLVAAYVFTLSHPGSVVPDSLGLPADTAVRRDTLPRRR
jgi:cytochrome c oxidase cbb3-type subunit 3